MDIGGMDPDNWVFADPTISVSAVAFPSPGGRLPFSSNSKLVSPGSDRDIEYTMQQLEPANGGTFNPALTLPELLLRVFSFLPAGDLFNDALVCKTWLPAALETLWTKRDVPLHAVLGILPFLRRTSDGYMIAWDLVSYPLPDSMPQSNDGSRRYLERRMKLSIKPFGRCSSNNTRPRSPGSVWTVG